VRTGRDFPDAAGGPNLFRERPQGGRGGQKEKPRRFKDIEQIVEEFFSTPLPDRLDALIRLLRTKDPDLTSRLQKVKAEVEFRGRPVIGRHHVDVYVGRDLKLNIRPLLYQLMVERLLGVDTGLRFEEANRHAAGLWSMSDADKFFTPLHSHLVANRRRVE
jgi:hypothetical protein